MPYCINSQDGTNKMIIDVSNYVVTNQFAYGGEITTDASGYIYHTFTKVGDANILTILRDVDASILLVGGGSAGAWDAYFDPGAGGGGGGEVVEFNQFLPRGKYRITVGKGGSGLIDNVFGTSSKFDIYIDASGSTDVSTGVYWPGKNSGSGKKGGTGRDNSNHGGGGAGDSSVGGNVISTYHPEWPGWEDHGGVGGDGTQSSITGLWYAGGGGGSSNLVGEVEIGGLGYGGNGNYLVTSDSGKWAQDGQVNKGAGGGGGGVGTSGSGQSYSKEGIPPTFPAPIRAASGGSGVVVVRIKY